MSVYPDVRAGQRVTAALLQDMLPIYIRKTAHTDRASNTVMTADPDLAVDLVASAVYSVEFALFIGGVVPVVTDWDVPSGADGYKGCQGPGSAATSDDNINMRSGTHNFETDITYGYRSTANTSLEFIQETGIITTTTAGTLALRWAQSSSNASFTRMGDGSWLRVIRIG